jgi:hypothetical protein
MMLQETAAVVPDPNFGLAQAGTLSPLTSLLSDMQKPLSFGMSYAGYNNADLDETLSPKPQIKVGF